MQFLSENHFHKLKLHFIKSNHYKVIAKINGVKGHFILDTGGFYNFCRQKFKRKIQANF